MNVITTKTEFLVMNVNYNKINFGKLISLAVAQINQFEPKLDTKGNIVATLPLRECADFLGYEATSDRYLKDSIDRLIKSGMKENLLTLTSTKDETEKHFLITGYKTSVKKDTIELFFNKDLMDKIFVNSLDDDRRFMNRYVIYDVTMFKDCSNADTLFLYEFFKLYVYKKEKYNQAFKTTVDELKKLLDINHKVVNAGKGKQKIKLESYKDYKTFKHFVLSPALKFINKHTDITVKIISEERREAQYTLNGVTKTIKEVDDIVFLIERKSDSKYSSSIAHEIAMETGNNLESVKEIIVKNTEILNKAGINVDKKQVAVLLKLCNDISLVKLSLWDATRIDAVNDIGAFAYSKIKTAKENKELKVLKTRLKESYDSSRKIKKKKPTKYKLDNIDSKDASLVELYNLYNDLIGNVTEKDVAMMKRAMTEFHNFQIKNAILYAVKFKNKKGEKINSFKYIATCLNKRIFWDRASYNNISDNTNKVIEISNPYEEDAFDFDKFRECGYELEEIESKVNKKSINFRSSSNAKETRHIGFKDSNVSGAEMIKRIEAKLGTGEIVDFDSIFRKK